MNRIEQGNIYTASRKRTGKTEHGDWELLATQDERGGCSIAVFVTNRPSGVEEGGKFRIERILSVSHSNRKDSNGEWRANISIDAEVTPVMSYHEFSEQAEDTDGDLPF